MWEKSASGWSRNVWGRKSRRDCNGRVVSQEARVDLRHDQSGEIVNLFVTLAANDDLSAAIEATVQDNLVRLGERLQPEKLELENLAAEQRRLEQEIDLCQAELAAIVQRLANMQAEGELAPSKLIL